MSGSSHSKSTSKWNSGSTEDILKAQKALKILSEHNAMNDNRDFRIARRDAFRRGGVDAVEQVWLSALDVSTHPNIPYIRAPETWKPRNRTSDADRMRLYLARHMYARYSVPSFLENIWLSLPVARDSKVKEVIHFASWYKAAATGGSLYKLCAAPAKLLSRRECHYFLTSPDWVTPEQAIWRARALGAGGSPSDADAVARSRLVRLAGNALSTPSERWLAVVRFIVSEKTLRGEELEEALDWIQAMMTENPNWSISGRKAKSVHTASKAWHRMLARQKEWSTRQWEGMPVSDWSLSLGEENSPNHKVWLITQLLTGKALATEGSQMRHCVSSYINRAASGNLGIFSLTVARFINPVERALTIEVSSDFHIVQVRGKANRFATNEEMNVVGKWASDSGLTGSGKF